MQMWERVHIQQSVGCYSWRWTLNYYCPVKRPLSLTSIQVLFTYIVAVRDLHQPTELSSQGTSLNEDHSTPEKTITLE